MALNKSPQHSLTRKADTSMEAFADYVNSILCNYYIWDWDVAFFLRTCRNKKQNIHIHVSYQKPFGQVPTWKFAFVQIMIPGVGWIHSAGWHYYKGTNKEILLKYFHIL